MGIRNFRDVRARRRTPQFHAVSRVERKRIQFAWNAIDLRASTTLKPKHTAKIIFGGVLSREADPTQEGLIFLGTI